MNHENIIPLPRRAWMIPPAERKLSDHGVRVYVEGELPLHAHNELWCWLYNLTTVEEAADRLEVEAQAFLAAA